MLGSNDYHSLKDVMLRVHAIIPGADDQWTSPPTGKHTAACPSIERAGSRVFSRSWRRGVRQSQ